MNRSLVRLLSLLAALFFTLSSMGSSKPRLCVLTDIGGDPDDQQSLIRLMVYSNEFRIEGLLATASGTPGENKDSSPRPDLIREIVNAYGHVRANLARHAKGWPKPAFLGSVIKVGQADRGRSAIGPDQDTEASRWIIRRVDAGSSKDPLNIAIWGGQTDFAQALWRVRSERGADGLADFVERLRVYDIMDQDGLANWIRSEFAGLHYLLNKSPDGVDKRKATFRGMYLGGDESLTSREWIDANVRSRGPLGQLYPTKTWTAPNPHSCMKEGDTPSWFFFLPEGGNDPDDPTQPGWGGRFVQEPDGWYVDLPLDQDPRATVYRHRPEFQADFARRMRWCED